MENTNDILTSLRIASQIPLDRKSRCINEETLKQLGVNNNLAFTYYKGLEVTCIEERTKYEWKEVKIGEIGLLDNNFIYPNGLIIDGVDYSNKEYNFIEIITTENILNEVILNITIDKIRALTGNLSNTNFYTTDLGQEGNWYYDQNDTTTTDNTGTVLVTADGKRIKRIINNGILNVKWFGAKGDNINDDSISFLNCFATLSTKYSKIEIPATTSRYKITQPITVNSLISGGVGFSVFGSGSSGSVFIEYTGTGYFLNVLGNGAEGDNPITRFEISNIRVNGGISNIISDGGFNLKRVYIVKFENVYSTGWTKSDAVSVSIRNCFNVYWNGGQIANGFPNPTGSHSLVIGSETPDAWNTSNVEFKNMLIQYAGGNGVQVIQGGNIFDNLTFDNVSFGKNAGYSFYCDSPNVNNITLRNNHFESCGYTATPIPIPNTGHIFINRSVGVNISNNSFQDALTYITLNSVDAFKIGDGNKFFETGFYTLTGNTLLRLLTTTANCIGSFGENNIRTDQIDNLYSLTESGGFRIDLSRRFRTKALEATWNGDIFTHPLNYQGTLVDRYQSTNAPFDQMLSNGSSWFRLMVSSKYKGERTTIPSTTETVGSWYVNTTPTVKGTTGDSYMLFGWVTSGGGVWKEMRMQLDHSPFVVNGTTTDLSLAILNSTYPFSDSDNNIGKTIYCPSIVAGAKIYIRTSSTNWLTINCNLKNNEAGQVKVNYTGLSTTNFVAETVKILNINAATPTIVSSPTTTYPKSTPNNYGGFFASSRGSSPTGRLIENPINGQTHTWRIQIGYSNKASGSNGALDIILTNPVSGFQYPMLFTLPSGRTSGTLNLNAITIADGASIPSPNGYILQAVTSFTDANLTVEVLSITRFSEAIENL